MHCHGKTTFLNDLLQSVNCLSSMRSFQYHLIPCWWLQVSPHGHWCRLLTGLHPATAGISCSDCQQGEILTVALLPHL